MQQIQPLQLQQIIKNLKNIIHKDITKIKDGIKNSIIISHCILLTSCSIFSPVTTPLTHKFQIVDHNMDDNIDAPQCVAKNKAVIQIMPVRANAPYDMVKMFYSKSQYELDSYSYNQWVATPQSMIGQAIAQKILQSCLYTNTISGTFLATADYRLSTQLIELKQIIKNNSSTIVLTALVQLIDNASNEVIKSKTFIETTDNINSPEGFVVGANTVTQKFLSALIKWLES